MYFTLSKIVGFLALPSNAIALLCGLGCALALAGWRRAATATLGPGVVLLLVFGFSPAPNLLLLTLTERFPQWQPGGRDPDGIIILGGAIDTEATAARAALETDGSAERLFAMIELARRFPKAKLVFSGGSGNLIARATAEAPIAGRLLDQFALGNGRVLLETQSRTTEENALLSARLAAPRAGERWLLVTSAFHMPRAVGLFRAAGFEVEAYPVDFRTRGWADAGWPFGKLSQGLSRTDVAMHEWYGLVAAWVAGRSRTLFPAPHPR